VVAASVEAAVQGRGVSKRINKRASATKALEAHMGRF